jgi:hypothetical protein
MVFFCGCGCVYTVIAKRRGALRSQDRGEVVVVYSVSNHHCHSAWQMTELRWVYGDTAILDIVWATRVYRDAAAQELD